MHPTVHKFGGTSVADAHRIRAVAAVLAGTHGPRVVVTSALAGVTDLLVDLARGSDAGNGAALATLSALHLQAARDLDAEAVTRTRLLGRLARLRSDLAGEGPRRGDAVLAAGEDLAVILLADALKRAGVDARAVDARTVVRTTAECGGARPLAGATARAARATLLPLLRRGVVPVVQGFVGASEDGRTTTLGRGGSDLTAALLGSALDAAEVQIWTDVEGILSGDPDGVDDPAHLVQIGFEELVELCWAGAEVLHPGAAKWAVAHGVPLRIRSSLRPQHPGTVVRHDTRDAPGVAAVTAKKGVTLVTVRSRPATLPYGFLARVFGVLGRHRIEVDLVATSHTSTSFTVDGSENVAEVVGELSAFADVTVAQDLVTLTVVGRGFLRTPGTDARALDAVGDVPVLLVSHASDTSLSLVLERADAAAALRRLHARLVGPRAARRSA